MFGDPRKITNHCLFCGLYRPDRARGMDLHPFIPVPFTLQTLFVLLTGAVMKRYGAVPVALYILLGTLGLPLFHNGMTGPGVLLGPTGGYLIGFVFAALVVGLAYERKEKYLHIAGIALGTVIIYLFGVAWLHRLPPDGPCPGHHCRSRPLRDRRRDQGRCRIPDCRTAAMIAIRSLRHAHLAIDSLDISPGITSVIGPNGSGKTTLTPAPVPASISLKPELSLIGDRSPRDTETGWVNEFPDRNILFETVTDEIASPLRFRRVPCGETGKRVAGCLEWCGIPHLRDRSIRELSGGEKILVAFAAAIVHRPEVLILDECDSHLDASRTEILGQSDPEGVQSRTLSSAPSRWKSRHRAIRSCILTEGKQVLTGLPEEVFSRLSGTPFYPLSWRCRE